MSAVSDAGPFNYLILIGEATVLQDLFRRIVVPHAVLEEHTRPKTPQVVRVWMSDAPDWLEIQDIGGAPDPALRKLHSGEHEAILLAEEIAAHYLLIDERAGREAAERRGLRITGTIGILDKAAERGILNLSEAVDRLRQTPFHASPDLFEQLLRRHCTTDPPQVDRT